jgi:hypothetical protein
MTTRRQAAFVEHGHLDSCFASMVQSLALLCACMRYEVVSSTRDDELVAEIPVIAYRVGIIEQSLLCHMQQSTFVQSIG